MLTTTLCLVLSATGMVYAVRTAYRRRFLAATRLAALSLLPIGLAMAGLVTLGRKVGTAVGDWAADLVFKPTVWFGFMVLGVSALLYGATRLVAGRRSDGEEGQEGHERGQRAVPAAARSGSTPAPAIAAKRRGGGDSGLSDFSDVEEILKRRGI